MITEIKAQGALMGMGYPTNRLTVFTIRGKRCAIIFAPDIGATVDDLQILQDCAKLGWNTALAWNFDNFMKYLEQWEDDQGITGTQKGTV